MMVRRLACVAIVALGLTSVGEAAAGWVTTWGAAPLPPSPARGPFPAAPTFENQTIRQTLRLSLGGRRLRIRLSNEYGTKPLAVGAARVALADEQGNIQPGTEHVVQFGGKPGTLIPAGSPYLSDPVDLPVKALGTISVSLYLPENTGPCTCHDVGLQNAFVSDSGDFTDKAFTPKQTLQARAFISGVQVEGDGGKAVVVLGDSISDGVGSTLDANHRWPDLLADSLDSHGHGGWGVVNMGISGNRILGDGEGVSALARFDRDVLAVAGVKAVIIFEGVNDLGISFGHFTGPMAEAFKSMVPPNKATAEAMIAGYRQLIARAREHGLKVVGATITPYEGAGYYSPEGEVVRQEINTWIRAGKELDGVLDFDAAIRDPQHPTQIKDGFHAGDHLHGSDAGYRAMSGAIDLKLLR